MDNKIRVFALGGLDELGKDLYVIEIDNDIFIIECGIKLPDKTMPGIDFIMPQFDYLVENKDRIRGYIITHGHDLEIGALPFIYHQCPAPVYCTNVTRVYIEGFKRYTSMHDADIKYEIVNPTDERMIAGRQVRFFSTAHNIAQSFGVAISTEQGNIIFIDDFVIDYNGTPGFIYDAKALAKIGEEKTLLLMLESVYADRIGYTAPKYKAAPSLISAIKDAKGRLVFAIPSTDIYNFVSLAQLAIQFNRKIFVYDDETRECYSALRTVEPSFNVPERAVGHRDDINRYKESDIAIFMTGFGPKLFHKLELFATKANSDRRIRISENDTAIVVNPFAYENEISENDAINELYRVLNNVKYFRRNEFLKMHASEDDLRGAISLLTPKYYLPVRGSFSSLLANAKIALNTGLGLNHQNVFVLDNGTVLEITKNGAYIAKEEVKHGDLLIDGKVFGTHDSKALEERQKLSDDGVVVLGATVSLSKRAIVLGPDVQMRGFVFLKDSEMILREVTRGFIACIKQELAKDNFNVNNLYQTIEETIYRQVRRETGKGPLIIPHVAMID